MPLLKLHISEGINAQISKLMLSAGALFFEGKAIIEEDTCDKLNIS